MVPYHRQLTGVLTLLGVGLAQPGAAATSGALTEAGLPDDNAIANESLALDDESLNEIRGGFATSDGLQIAFGIERAVFVNGNLVTTTSFNLNLSDLGKLTQGAPGGSPNAAVNANSIPGIGSSAATANPGTTNTNSDVAVNVPTSGTGMAVIQNGSGNTFQPGAVLPSTMGTVIQNTLDNQNLQNVTFIQATVNSLGLLKSINMQNMVRDAINTSSMR